MHTPLEVIELSKFYNNEGADELVFLDITASHEKRKAIIDVVEKVSSEVFIPLTVGGGVRSVDDISKLLNCGADKVSINTAAVQNADVVFQSLNGEMEYDYSDFGGLKNTKATNYTGDVNIVLPACAAGDTGTVVCEWIKVYE